MHLRFYNAIFITEKFKFTRNTFLNRNKLYLLKVRILVFMIQKVEILNIKDLLLQNIDKSSSDQGKLIAIFYFYLKQYTEVINLLAIKNSA